MVCADFAAWLFVVLRMGEFMGKLGEQVGTDLSKVGGKVTKCQRPLRHTQGSTFDTFCVFLSWPFHLTDEARPQFVV